MRVGVGQSEDQEVERETGVGSDVKREDIAALFVAAMREWKRSFEGHARSFAGLQTRIEKVMDVTMSREVERLERRLMVRHDVGEGKSRKVRTTLLQIGDAFLVGAPAEPYSAFQKEIRARFPGLGTPTALPYIGRDRGITRGDRKSVV